MRPRQLLALACVLCAQASAAGRDQVLRRTLQAPDGAAFTLYWFAPAHSSTAPPVLLVGELGFGRALFDLRGAGLARYLQARGRDAFVLEPRGQGASPSPAHWRLREIAELDVPAAIAAVQAVRPGPVDLVAHGFGGALALATTPDALARIRRAVAIATPAAAEVPNEAARELLRSGAAFGGDAGRFELLFARHGAFAKGALEALRQRALRPLGAEAAADLLGWMESGDLALGGGETLSSRLARYDRPTSLVLPQGDNFAHPEFASPLRDLARGRVEVRLISRLYLLREDYTHLSVLQGEGAQRDVFQPALEFLEAAR